MFHCARIYERTECKNYRDISLLSVVGIIYVGILVDRVCRATGGLINNEQWSFRAERVCVDQIFPLKQIEEKAREKNCSVCGIHRFGEGVR